MNIDFNIGPPQHSTSSNGCSSSSNGSSSSSSGGSSSGSSNCKNRSVPVDASSSSSSSYEEEEEIYKKVMQPLQYGETDELSGYHYISNLAHTNMGVWLKTRIKRLVSTSESRTNLECHLNYSECWECHIITYFIHYTGDTAYYIFLILFLFYSLSFLFSPSLFLYLGT